MWRVALNIIEILDMACSTSCFLSCSLYSIQIHREACCWEVIKVRRAIYHLPSIAQLQALCGAKSPIRQCNILLRLYIISLFITKDELLLFKTCLRMALSPNPLESMLSSLAPAPLGWYGDVHFLGFENQMVLTISSRVPLRWLSIRINSR